MDFLQPLIDRLGGPRRAMVFAMGAVIVVGILLTARWLSAPTYVPAFPNVPIDQVSKITEKLDGASIRYQLENGGAEIRVPQEDLARARVTVAAAGGAISSARPGMELFDQPSWGMTDFTQRINYRRALEGEMERTIAKMRGIVSAQVHITLPERGSLRRQAEPAQASVVLKLNDDATPGPDVVAGIAHLVAASVDGLKSDDVTVLSDDGRMLSLPNDPSGLGLSTRQIQMQRDIEKDLQRKVSEVVLPVVGAGNVRVQVSATLNFDHVERTTSAVNPDQQAVATQQKAEIVPGAQGGAGSSNVAVSYETTHSTENFVGSTGSVRRLAVALLINETMRVDSASKKIVPVPRSAAELANIRTLVAGAVGADSSRGDVISVVNMAFTQPPAPEPEVPLTLWQKAAGAQRLIMGLGGMLVALVVLLVLVRGVTRSAAAPAPAYSVARTSAPADPETRVQEELLEDPASAATQAGLRPELRVPAPIFGGLRDQIHTSIEASPENATRLIRAWLKEI